MAVFEINPCKTRAHDEEDFTLTKQAFLHIRLTQILQVGWSALAGLDGWRGPGRREPLQWSTRTDQTAGTRGAPPPTVSRRGSARMRAALARSWRGGEQIEYNTRAVHHAMRGVKGYTARHHLEHVADASTTSDDGAWREGERERERGRERGKGRCW